MTPAARARILVVAGTRPEVIKLAPVIQELGRLAPEVAVRVCVTGQHRELVDRTLAHLGLRPDRVLETMLPNQDLAGLTSRLFGALDAVLADERPDWLLVQGDTTSAMVGAVAAFYRRVKVGHVEAGLRTADLTQPFPEEFNRRVADLCADLCFAPTDAARDNLLREGVPAARVHVTGNTIVDAVQAIAARPYDQAAGPLRDVPRAPRWILVTAHRRESFGEPLQRICRAVQYLAVHAAASAHIIVPVHPNPNVQAIVRAQITAPNCTLVPPLDYADLVHVLRRAVLVLTDSGGLQEEAPTFGAPVLVMRDKTERPEGVAAGVATLVGTDPDRIIAEATAILRRDAPTGPVRNPYGDGLAAQRIVRILGTTLGVPVGHQADPLAAAEWRG